MYWMIETFSVMDSSTEKRNERIIENSKRTTRKATRLAVNQKLFAGLRQGLVGGQKVSAPHSSTSSAIRTFAPA